MKTLIMFFSLFLLMSCSEIFPNDGRFTVVNMGFTAKRDKVIYRLHPVRGRGNVYYIDNIGKYSINDTLTLLKNTK